MKHTNRKQQVAITIIVAFATFAVTIIPVLFASEIYLFLGFTPIEYWVPWTFWLVVFLIGVEAFHLFLTYLLLKQFFKPKKPKKDAETEAPAEPTPPPAVKPEQKTEQPEEKKKDDERPKVFFF